MLAFNLPGTTSFANAIGGGGINQEGGLLALTGNDTYTGATQISGGTLQAGAAARAS